MRAHLSSAPGGRLAVDVFKAVRAPVPPRDIREVLMAAAAVPEIAARLPGHSQVAVRVTGDRELRRLNRSFLGEDRPTDVLAFPAGDQSGHLGDIAISWPAVQRQAVEYGHAPRAELALLVTHGFIHLLGWDHAEESERREMTRLTLSALARAGVTLDPRRI